MTMPTADLQERLKFSVAMTWTEVNTTLSWSTFLQPALRILYYRNFYLHKYNYNISRTLVKVSKLQIAVGNIKYMSLSPLYNFNSYYRSHSYIITKIILYTKIYSSFCQYTKVLFTILYRTVLND